MGNFELYHEVLDAERDRVPSPHHPLTNVVVALRAARRPMSADELAGITGYMPGSVVVFLLQARRRGEPVVEHGHLWEYARTEGPKP